MVPDADDAEEGDRGAATGDQTGKDIIAAGIDDVETDEKDDAEVTLVAAGAQEFTFTARDPSAGIGIVEPVGFESPKLTFQSSGCLPSNAMVGSTALLLKRFFMIVDLRSRVR